MGPFLMSKYLLKESNKVSYLSKREEGLAHYPNFSKFYSYQGPSQADRKGQLTLEILKSYYLLKPD